MRETYPVPPPLELAEDPRYAGWLARPLELAAAAGRAGDVPVGAVVVSESGEVLGEGGNVREATGDPTGHAEVVALRAASNGGFGGGSAGVDGHGGGWRLDGATLVVTLEPCIMCVGAMLLARVSRVVFGAWDPKAGACGSVWDLARDSRTNHWVEVVGGVREAECRQLLVDFFTARRLG